MSEIVNVCAEIGFSMGNDHNQVGKFLHRFSNIFTRIAVGMHWEKRLTHNNIIRTTFFKGWVVIALGSLCMLSGCDLTSSQAVSFNRDVRPILNEKCLKCHGGVKANGGFSLLFEEDAFARTES